MISDNSLSVEEDGAGKVNPSTSCKSRRPQKINWIPTPEKETYRTVVVNYRYAKMDKNYPRNTAAVSKKKHWSRMIAAMAAKHNSDGDEDDDDDVPNLRKLYQCSQDDMETVTHVPGTPAPSFENIIQSKTEAIKLEPYCVPLRQKATILDPLRKTFKINEIESACCRRAKPKQEEQRQPQLEESESEQDPDTEPNSEAQQQQQPQPQSEADPDVDSEQDLMFSSKIDPEPEPESEPEHAPDPKSKSILELEPEPEPEIEPVSEPEPNITLNETCALRKMCERSSTPPFDLYPQVVVLAEEDEDDEGNNQCPRKKAKWDDAQQPSCPIRITSKAALSSGRQSERKHTTAKNKIRIEGTCSEHNVKKGSNDTKGSSTDCGTQLKLKPPQNGLKQRQLELHRYRIAVEQKRLELLEVKLARERDEMLREQILFEKDLELKTSQLKEIIDDKQLDIL